MIILPLKTVAVGTVAIRRYGIRKPLTRVQTNDSGYSKPAHLRF